jgi:hypothetical protein
MASTTLTACAAVNRRGEPCAAAVVRGKTLCPAHDPATAFGRPDQVRAAGRLSHARERRAIERLETIVREAGIASQPQRSAREVLAEVNASSAIDQHMVGVYGEDGQDRPGYARRRGHKLREAA